MKEPNLLFCLVEIDDFEIKTHRDCFRLYDVLAQVAIMANEDSLVPVLPIFKLEYDSET